MRGLDHLVRAALDRRLLPASDRPLTVALSGGGDSLALTLIADAWAREQGRELLILTVDHGLQTESVAWTETCRAVAVRLGRPFRALAWTGPKPSTGLPAAARAARHRLLADTAREAGARVILMGHTADDIAESQAMRAAGSTTPDPREWAPSPAWPEGRGVFVLRPMLDIRRAELRCWLAERGEAWIDDPANDHPHYARSRARTTAPPPVERHDPKPLDLAADVIELPGGLALSRRAFREARAEDAARLLAIACVCAGGGARRPAGPRVVRLAAALRGAADVSATLAGAKVEADVTTIHLGREPGRRPAAPIALRPAVPSVWDGRFELTATRPVLISAMAGTAGQLPACERRRLAELPAVVRGGLPCARGDPPTCPLFNPDAGITTRSLVGERLRAASGLVEREGA